MKPEILLVHGAYHGPWCFDPILPGLRNAGVETHRVELPFESLAGDAQAVRQALSTLGPEVTLLGHSYGGAVISWAAAGLANVKQLVFLSAMVPDTGEALGDAATEVQTESPILEAMRFEPDGSATIEPVAAGELFFHDCSPEERDWAVSKLRAAKSPADQTPIPEAGWRAIPSHYIVCVEDRIVPAEVQRRLATRAGAKLWEVSTGHSPFLAAPQALVEILSKIAGV